VERFHKTVLEEFYRVAFRKKTYRRIDELQIDLDAWIRTYNEEREHRGRWCFGKTPMQTFLDAKPLAKEKMITARSASDRRDPTNIKMPTVRRCLNFYKVLTCP
jgi:hypothetical protein